MTSNDYGHGSLTTESGVAWEEEEAEETNKYESGAGKRTVCGVNGGEGRVLWSNGRGKGECRMTRKKRSRKRRGRGLKTNAEVDGI